MGSLYKITFKLKNVSLENFVGNSFFHERYLSTSCLLNKIIPSSGKSSSSHEWLKRQLNDVYVKKCRYDRYRCRSAYKLLEIDDKYKILKPGQSVVDCGAAPGSWTQVIVQRLNSTKKLKEDVTPGVAIAVDLQYMHNIKGATIIQESNFTDQSVQERIFHLLPGGRADAVLSDMAPKATGTASIDTIEILKLAYSALGFSVKVLKKDGTFLCKVWDSQEVQTLCNNLQTIFSSVKRIKPKASRSESSELFLLARGYKGISLNK